MLGYCHAPNAVAPLLMIYCYSLSLQPRPSGATAPPSALVTWCYGPSLQPRSSGATASPSAMIIWCYNQPWSVPRAPPEQTPILHTTHTTLPSPTPACAPAPSDISCACPLPPQPPVLITLDRGCREVVALPGEGVLPLK